jgi:hypothetical protein
VVTGELNHLTGTDEGMSSGRLEVLWFKVCVEGDDGWCSTGSLEEGTAFFVSFCSVV